MCFKIFDTVVERQFSKLIETKGDSDEKLAVSTSTDRELKFLSTFLLILTQS